LSAQRRGLFIRARFARINKGSRFDERQPELSRCPALIWRRSSPAIILPWHCRQRRHLPLRSWHRHHRRLWLRGLWTGLRLRRLWRLNGFFASPVSLAAATASMQRPAILLNDAAHQWLHPPRSGAVFYFWPGLERILSRRVTTGSALSRATRASAFTGWQTVSGLLARPCQRATPLSYRTLTPLYLTRNAAVPDPFIAPRGYLTGAAPDEAW
jgi:hypothetical protein